jgi:hypothetical protein
MSDNGALSIYLSSSTISYSSLCCVTVDTDAIASGTELRLDMTIFVRSDATECIWFEP